MEIIFGNQNQQYGHAEKYQIVDNHIGDTFKWQIGLLQNIPFSPIETYWPNKPSHSWDNLVKLTEEIQVSFDYKVDFELVQTQECANRLHKIYEKIHAYQNITKQNLDLLHEFHHAIHQTEKNDDPIDYWKIDWGYKSGPCTKKGVLHEHYEYPIKSNHVVSKWVELGKTPLNYFLNREPNDQNRINELIKPHITVRPTFFIHTTPQVNHQFPQTFIDWWKQYSESWCNHYDVDDWQIQHEYGGILLATPLNSQTVDWHIDYPLVTKISVI